MIKSPIPPRIVPVIQKQYETNPEEGDGDVESSLLAFVNQKQNEITSAAIDNIAESKAQGSDNKIIRHTGKLSESTNQNNILPSSRKF